MHVTAHWGCMDIAKPSNMPSVPMGGNLQGSKSPSDLEGDRNVARLQINAFGGDNNVLFCVLFLQIRAHEPVWPSGKALGW